MNICDQDKTFLKVLTSVFRCSVLETSPGVFVSVWEGNDGQQPARSQGQWDADSGYEVHATTNQVKFSHLSLTLFIKSLITELKYIILI